MLNTDQLKALNLKANIVMNLLNDASIDAEEVIEYLNLEGVEDPIDKLDSAFNLLCGTLRDNKLRTPINIDIKNIFDSIIGENSISKFYIDFLNILVNDDINNEISARLNNLLELSVNDVPYTSEIKKLYIYTVLVILLAIVPTDMEKVDYYNEELKKFL